MSGWISGLARKIHFHISPVFPPNFTGVHSTLRIMATKAPYSETRHKMVESSVTQPLDCRIVLQFVTLVYYGSAFTTEWWNSFTMKSEVADSAHIRISNSKLLIFESAQRPPPGVHQSLGHRLSLKLTPLIFTVVKNVQFGLDFATSVLFELPSLRNEATFTASWKLTKSRQSLQIQYSSIHSSLRMRGYKIRGIVSAP